MMADGAGEALELETSGAKLTVARLADGWHEVHVWLDGVQHRLGADAPKKVLMKLAAGLADELPGKEAGKIRGLPVRVMMSLFEEHCTIYAADDEGARLWIVQRPDLSLLGTIRIPREDRVRWLAQVSAAQGR